VSGPGRFLRDLLLVLGGTLAIALAVTRFVAIPWVVAGPSMQPTLHPGDHVLVDLWSYGRRPPAAGEVALLQGPGGAPLVKRITALVPDPQGTAGNAIRYQVLGDNREASEDSRLFGSVPRERFRGRVVWRYWPLSRAGPIR
jgi:signal peptidase I